MLIFAWIAFFLLQVKWHSEAGLTLCAVLLSLWLLRHREAGEEIIYAFGLVLGLLIEVGLGFVFRMQHWTNASLLGVPFWLPIIWGFGFVTARRVGNVIVAKFDKLRLKTTPSCATTPIAGSPTASGSSKCGSRGTMAGIMGWPSMIPSVGIIERALELARSGEYKTPDQIKKRLLTEGYSVSGHFEGAAIRKQIYTEIRKSVGAPLGRRRRKIPSKVGRQNEVR